MTRPDPRAAFTFRVPHVSVDAAPDAALRLDGALGDARARPAPTGGDRLADLFEILARHCDPWRRGERRFLERYCDFVSDQVESNRDMLAAGLARFGGVFRYDDWVYSALMPLPRAHLHAPADDEAFGPETLVRVDFAFWTGTTAIAVELVGAGTRSTAADRRHARLRRAGVRVVELSPDLLDARRGAAFDAALPGELRRFWRGRALPAGPLKPAALDVAIDEI